MGDKGKKDRGRREEHKKSKQTLKEKRKQKRDKLKPLESTSALAQNNRAGS